MYGQGWGNTEMGLLEQNVRCEEGWCGLGWWQLAGDHPPEGQGANAGREGHRRADKEGSEAAPLCSGSPAACLVEGALECRLKTNGGKSEVKPLIEI